MNTLLCFAVASVVVSRALAAGSAVSVTPSTHGPKHHYFGYIGQSRTIPWNANGRYVLALRVGFQDRLPRANDPADVCLLDTRANYAVRVVDQSRGWNPQQGTMFYWNPEHPETQFFFNDRDRDTGKVFTVLFEYRVTAPKRARGWSAESELRTVQIPQRNAADASILLKPAGMKSWSLLTENDAIAGNLTDGPFALEVMLIGRMNCETKEE